MMRATRSQRGIRAVRGEGRGLMELRGSAGAARRMVGSRQERRQRRVRTTFALTACAVMAMLVGPVTPTMALADAPAPEADPRLAAEASPGPDTESATDAGEPLGGVSIAEIVGTALPDVPDDTTWIRVGEDAAFTFEVPSSWTGVRNLPWLEADGSTSGTVILAGPDPEVLGTEFSQPGVAIGVSSNPNGLSPRQVVDAESYDALCSGSPVEDHADPAYLASSRVWTSCGGREEAFLLVLAIAPTDSPGLLGAFFQGVSEADLAYVQHIMGSLRAGQATETPATGPLLTPVPQPLDTLVPAPAPITQPTEGTSRGWTATLDECLLQMNDAIAYGTVTNTDDRSHGYRVYVRFLDATGLLIGEGYWDTPPVEPDQSARYEVRLLAVNGVTEATCLLKEVLVRD